MRESALQIVEKPQADPGFKLGKAEQNLKLKCGTCPKEASVDQAFSTFKHGVVLAVHEECLSWLPPSRVL